MCLYLATDDMLGFDFSMGPQHPLSLNVWITCWYHEFSIWKNEIHHFHPPSILLPANSYDWSYYPFSHQVPCHGPYLIFLRLSQGVPNWHLVFFSPAVLDFYCCISRYHEFRGFKDAHLLSPRSMRGQVCSAEFSAQGLTVKLLASLVFSFEGSRKKNPLPSSSIFSHFCQLWDWGLI